MVYGMTFHIFSSIELRQFSRLLLMNRLSEGKNQGENRRLKDALHERLSDTDKIFFNLNCRFVPNVRCLKPRFHPFDGTV